MWVATIDFMKAFDSITDKSFWNALNSSGIEHEYMCFLEKLYKYQKATVLTDEETDMFEIKNGTKQGDPLSSLLFNTVLQTTALKQDIPRWQRPRLLHKYKICTSIPICFPRRAASKNATSSAAQKKWDRIHPGKTKILSNQSSNSRTEIEIDNIKVEILTREESIFCLLSSSRRRLTSGIASGLLGQHSASTNKR